MFFRREKENKPNESYKRGDFRMVKKVFPSIASLLCTTSSESEIELAQQGLYGLMDYRNHNWEKEHAAGLNIS